MFLLSYPVLALSLLRLSKQFCFPATQLHGCQAFTVAHRDGNSTSLRAALLRFFSLVSSLAVANGIAAQAAATFSAKPYK